MPNIDDLSISVKSNVTSATNSIDKLITKLGALSASLGQVNTSGFSAMASGIRQITSATKSDSVKSITELANSIKKFGHQGTNTAIKNIPNVAQSIQLLANTVNGVNTDAVSGITNIAKSISRLGYATADKAITNIPQINTQLQGLIGTVNSLSSSANGISYLSQLSSALTKLGGKTGTTAISNIPSLTKALNQMIATLSKAPQVSYNVIQLVNSLANLASQGSKVGTASNSLYNGFMRFGKGADHARKKSFSLASAIGKLYASYFLLFRAFRGIGKGIGLASDLTEVQNVVDVSFGQYRDRLEQFADTSIVDYGMSELTAKQIASRYQAMGGAIGFAQGEMADMSIELTKLAADMASFYNVEQAAVAEDLEAIFTGQTRPLRTYGLDLTQATLQEWALSQGMEANIATMTQAEKVMLRYQYVLAQTGMAQGDFQRTQGTWANQIRILRQQFEALGAIIGQNFIYALKPVVTALNTVMAKLIQFARVVSNSLGKIFGWKYEDTTGGIADDLEFGAEAADDLGSGLGGAADKAKKLKQQLQGFDELNVLTSDQGGSGGGGGGGALGDTDVSATGGQWVRDNTEKFFESDLDSLYKLGDYIGTTLTNQLRSIKWDEVYQGARNFGSGLASFLNGLISPELFSATGATIAGALNTAIYSTLAFGETFDFEEFGLSIAEGINTFFRDTDFTALGQDIKAWVQGLKTTLITIIKEIEWGDILSGIGDVLKSLDAETIATLFGFATLSMVFKRGLFSTLGATLGAVTTLPAVLTTGLNGIGAKIKVGFIGGLTAAFGGFKIGEWIYEQITGDDTSDINYLDYFLGEGKASAEEWWGAVKEYIKNDIITIEDGSVAEAIINSVTGKSASEISSKRNGEPTKKIRQFAADVSKYFGASDKSVSTFTTNYGENFESVTETTEVASENQKSLSDVLLESFSNIAYGSNDMKNDVVSDYTNMSTQSTNKVLGLKSNVTAGMMAINNSVTTNTSTMAKNAIAQFTSMFNGGKTQTTNLKNNATNLVTAMASNISTKLGAMNVDSNTKFGIFDANAKNKFASAKDNAVSQIGNMSTFVANKLSAMNTDSNKKFATFNSYATSNFAFAKTSAETQVGAMATSISGKLGAVNADSDSKLTSLVALVANRTSAMVADSNSNFGKFQGGADTGLANMQSTVGARMANIAGVITRQSWYSPGTQLVAGLANGIADKWGSTSGTGLVGKIVSLAKGLTAALKKAFGIHSPSRIWKEDIGYYLAEGLRLGVVGEESHITRDIIGMGNRLTNSFSGALTLATPSSLSNGYDFGVTSTMSHNFSADTSMTSNIADGVRQGLSSSQAEQNALLREQNELLMRILDKTGISSSDLFNAVRRESRQHYNQTGTSAFVY